MSRANQAALALARMEKRQSRATIKPVASLAIVRPGRGTQARKRLDTLARV